MPHRNQDIRRFCVVCEDEASKSCLRCNLSYCKAHSPKRGKRCEACESEYQLILVDKGLDKLVLRKHGGKAEAIARKGFLPSLVLFNVSMIFLSHNVSALPAFVAYCSFIGLLVTTPFMLYALLKSTFDHSSDHFKAKEQKKRLKQTRKKFLRTKLKGPRFKLNSPKVT